MKKLLPIFSLVLALLCIAGTQISQIGYGPTAPTSVDAKYGWRLWYDTNDFQFLYWNGTAFVSFNAVVTNKLTKGGDSDGTTLIAGTNDVQTFSLETANTNRYSISGAGAHNMVLIDNTATALDWVIAGGNTMLLANTTNGAERLTLGSDATDARVAVRGRVNAASQTITTTASTSIQQSVVFYNLASSGTVVANMSGFVTDDEVLFINQAEVGSGINVTVSLSGAAWYSGSNPVLAPGETRQAHVKGGVLYVF